MAVVNDLVTKFSFQGSTSPLMNYNKSLAKGIGILAGFTTALAATSAAVTKWATDVLAGVDSIEQLSRSTNVSVEYIQEMGYVAEQTGSSVGAVESTISSLSQKIGEAAQKGSEDFARLGISVRDANGQVKGSDQILEEVRNRFNQLGLSMAEQRSFAEALGIDQSLLQMLGKTSAEMDNMRSRAKELGILTSEQADQAVSYNNSIKSLRFGLDGLKRLIAVGLAPQMQELVEGFTELVSSNKNWIVNGIQATMEFISEFMKALGRLWPVLAAGAVAFLALKIATLGWAGALAVVFSPAYLIAGAIAAILLIVDDLIVAFRGGDSVIANFFQKFFDYDIVPVLEGVVEAAKWMIELLGKMFSDFMSIIKGILGAIVNLFTGNFQAAWDSITSIFSATKTAEFLKEPFLAFFNWLESMWDKVIGKIQGLVDKIKSIKDKIPFLGGDDDEVNITANGKTVGGAQESRPTSITGMRGVPMSNRVDQNVNIEIKTDSPERAGKSVRDNLNRQLEDAQTQARRGGR